MQTGVCLFHTNTNWWSGVPKIVQTGVNVSHIDPNSLCAIHIPLKLLFACLTEMQACWCMCWYSSKLVLPCCSLLHTVFVCVSHWSKLVFACFSLTQTRVYGCVSTLSRTGVCVLHIATECSLRLYHWFEVVFVCFGSYSPVADTSTQISNPLRIHVPKKKSLWSLSRVGVCALRVAVTRWRDLL